MNDAEKALIEINGKLGGIETSVNDIKHCLFGNGQPGLARRFEALSEQHQSCLKKHEAEYAAKEKVFDKKMAVFTGIATVAIPVVWELLKTLIGRT